MPTNFQRQMLTDRLLKQIEVMTDEARESNKFFTQSITMINAVIQDEALIKSIYPDQSQEANVKQYLEDIKLMAEGLVVANDATIVDSSELKLIIERLQPTSEQLLRLQKKVQDERNSALSIEVEYRKVYQEAVERVPFLEISEKIPVS